MSWIVGFVVTQLVETPLYVMFQRGRSVRWRCAIGFGASVLSHPTIWFVLPEIIGVSYWSYVLLAELYSIAFEIAYMYAFIGSLRRAVMAALIANVASASMGFALTAWSGGSIP